MKQIKHNKSKVWRKCYGKPFLARKAICIAQMAVTAAHGQAQISAILNYGAPGNVVVAQRAVVVAQAATKLTKAMANDSHEMNKGFCS